MKKILLLCAFVTSLFILSGCATHTVTTTTAKDGTVTVTEKSKADPLLTKTVEQYDNFYGLDFNFLGTSGFSPFHIKVGLGSAAFRTLPTSSNQVHVAALNRTAHNNRSLIQQADDENMASGTNALPAAAYLGPNVTTLNPIVQGVPATANPVSTNTAAK